MDARSEGDVARAIFESGGSPSGRPAMHSERIEAAVAEAARAAEDDASAQRCLRSGALLSDSSSEPLVLAHRSTFGTLPASTGELVAAHRVQLATAPVNRRDGNGDPPVSIAIRSCCRCRDRSVVAQNRAAHSPCALSAGYATEQQRSLFDGRADAGRSNYGIVATLDASLLRIVSAVTSPADRAATRTELVAAWSECDG